MEDKLSYFKNPSNRLEKETFLMNYKYLSGEALPGEEDYKYMALMHEVPDRNKYPNLFYWWWSLYPFSEYSRKLWHKNLGKPDDQKINDPEISLLKKISIKSEGPIDFDKYAFVDVIILSSDADKSKLTTLAHLILAEIKIPHVEWKNNWTVIDSEKGPQILKVSAIIEKMQFCYLDLPNLLTSKFGNAFKIKVEEIK